MNNYLITRNMFSLRFYDVQFWCVLDWKGGIKGENQWFYDKVCYKFVETGGLFMDKSTKMDSNNGCEINYTILYYRNGVKQVTLTDLNRSNTQTKIIHCHFRIDI